jgi:hypothetical protein
VKKRLPARRDTRKEQKMPLCCDPQARYPYVLRGDRQSAKKPADQQPRFFLRYLTVRQWRKYCALGDQSAEDLRTMPAGVLADRLLGLLALVVASWEGLRRPDGSEVAPPVGGALNALEEVLSITEVWELYYAGQRQSELTEDDRKNSPSPSLGGSEASAAATAAGTQVAASSGPAPPSP